MANKRDSQNAPARKRRSNNRAEGLRPDYYKLKCGKQVIDIIHLILEAYVVHMKHPLDLFCLGNAVKYEMRSGLKPGASDDEKKRDTYLAMGQIDSIFWQDIAIPVIRNAQN